MVSKTSTYKVLKAINAVAVAFAAREQLMAVISMAASTLVLGTALGSFARSSRTLAQIEAAGDEINSNLSVSTCVRTKTSQKENYWQHDEPPLLRPYNPSSPHNYSVTDKQL